MIRSYLLIPLVILAGIFGPFFGVSHETRTKDISWVEHVRFMPVQSAWAHSHVPQQLRETLPRRCENRDTPYQSGIASWYGPGFHGRLMANGKAFNMHAYTVAHKHLPLGTRVCISNPRNGKTILATVTDRGPFVKGRVVDLSKKIAEELDIIQRGHAPVEIHIENS
jgi:rare lipoprotein A (peptidoglycan hydrolase)